MLGQHAKRIQLIFKIICIGGLIVLQGCASKTPAPPTVKVSDLKNSETAVYELIEASEIAMDHFLTAEHWAAVKSLTGVAKGIFIIPTGKQGGLLVSGMRGYGILLKRHKHDWSDPVIIKMSGMGIGLLIGGQKFNGAGAILTNQAMDDFLEGKIRYGGGADTTIGPGLSGRVAGSTGGIELLMVSSNKGFFLSGSFEGVKITVEEELNKKLYGEEFDQQATLNQVGGKISEATGLREKLQQAAFQAVFGDD